MKRPLTLFALAALALVSGCSTNDSTLVKPLTLEKQFVLIDVNRDGRISREEYGKYLVNEMKGYVDTDSDGLITRDEFIAFGGKPANFDKFDTSGNGSLTADEVKANPEALRLLTAAAVGADASGDGYVTLAEAKAYQAQVREVFR